MGDNLIHIFRHYEMYKYLNYDNKNVLNKYIIGEEFIIITSYTITNCVCYSIIL